MKATTTNPRPTVHLDLTVEEAELLKEILYAIKWVNATGTFAESLCEALDDAGVQTQFGETYKYENNEGIEIILAGEQQ